MNKKIVYIIGILSGIGIGICLHVYANNNYSYNRKEVLISSSNDLPINDIRTFTEVYGQIKANYYKDTMDKDLIQYAIKGLVSNLDPHSEYLNVEDLNDLKDITKGEFGGLGIQISSQDGYIKVITPLAGTPADKVGIKSGDYIVKINDENTRGLSLTTAVKKMKGDPGTRVKLTIARTNNPTPLEFTITRAIIKSESVQAHLLEKDYAYIRLTQFQEKSLDELINKLNKVVKNQESLKGIILDLRNNPGGVLQVAVGISAVFLPENKVIVSTKGKSFHSNMVLYSRESNYSLAPGLSPDPMLKLNKNVKNLPLVVLINSGSASASEIVTGALQDYKRAVVVGNQSFGKGSVQSVLPLSNGCGVKITTALYYTPNDRSIQAKGIVPDVKVVDENSIFEVREADLGGHLNNPLGGKEVKGELKINKANNKSDDKSSISPESNGSKKDEQSNIDNNPFSLTWKPNPEKDVQLKQALTIIKDSGLYNRNLGRHKEIEKDFNTKN